MNRFCLSEDELRQQSDKRFNMKWKNKCRSKHYQSVTHAMTKLLMGHFHYHLPYHESTYWTKIAIETPDKVHQLNKRFQIYYSIQ